jgi:hypothetical protein
MDQQQGASTKTGSLHDGDSDHESQSGDSGDIKTASDNSRRLKVAAAAALARISYDFGPSKITKTLIWLMESYAHYFPKGYGWPPGMESVPESKANEAIVIEDFFFAAGLRMLPHLVLTNILPKFRLQLHHLMSNAIVTISKSIWVVTSYGVHPTADVFTQHYEVHYQNKKNSSRGMRDYPRRVIWMPHLSPQPLWRMGKTYPCREEQLDKWLG